MQLSFEQLESLVFWKKKKVKEQEKKRRKKKRMQGKPFPSILERALLPRFAPLCFGKMVCKEFLRL